jgi:hypothetical protein
LEEYFELYTSPFPQNQQYLAQLASTINWEAVVKGEMKIRGRDFARFRALGDFLMTYELPKVLTWESIDKALPSLEERNVVRVGYIRSCLFQLGDLLVAQGKLQPWDLHLSKGALNRSLLRTPAAFQNHMSDFQQWLLQGNVNPNLQVSGAKTERLSNARRTIVEMSSMVAQFLNFCSIQNISSLPEIGMAIIAEYQETIAWHFECRKCNKRISANSLRSIKTCPNRECRATESYVRTRRLTRGSLVHHMSALRLFFDWAMLRKLVAGNPLTAICCGGARTFTVRRDDGGMLVVGEAIRRYDDTVVERLCADIVSPDTDPEEAVMLYLIIFHLLTNSDLRNLRIPSLVNSGNDSPQRTDDFEYLHLPLRQITRGNRSVLREETRILFPRKALGWLRPILERHYEKRARLVKSQHQQHFLVGEGNGFWNAPVTKDYVRDRVRSASLRVLGAAVTASDLRRTAADMFARRSKRRGAILTVMGFSALSATRFNYLESFTLQPKKAHAPKKQHRDRKKMPEAK